MQPIHKYPRVISYVSTKHKGTPLHHADELRQYGEVFLISILLERAQRLFVLNSCEIGVRQNLVAGWFDLPVESIKLTVKLP